MTKKADPTLVPYVMTPIPLMPQSAKLHQESEHRAIRNSLNSIIDAVLDLQKRIAALEP